MCFELVRTLSSRKYLRVFTNTALLAFNLDHRDDGHGHAFVPSFAATPVRMRHLRKGG